jgi:hypothetical protein
VAGTSGSGGGGGGHTAAYVGGALVALIPLGFAGSWLVRRHLADVMAGSYKGRVLPADRSVWQRFWKSSGGAPSGDGQG